MSKDTIYREDAIKKEERRKAAEWFRNRAKGCPMPATRRMYEIATEALEEPKAENMKRLTNREWKDFLSEQFGVSKTSAKEMLHGMMRWKKEDNFKRQFSQGKSDLVKDLVNEQTKREGE